MAQQTAVEWLYDNLKSHFEHNAELLEVVRMSFIQAKSMEKHQMCNHFSEGYMWCNSPSLKLINGEIVTNTWKYGELYYNETYNK